MSQQIDWLSVMAPKGMCSSQKWLFGPLRGTLVAASRYCIVFVPPELVERWQFGLKLLFRTCVSEMGDQSSTHSLSSHNHKKA